MPASRPAIALLASSSLVICACSLLRWRARRRAKTVADRAEKLSSNGPMVDRDDEAAQQRILDTAIRRASKWMSYQNTNVTQMQGQVGGISKNKRRMMSLAPDYVLKHVRPDHRGYREVAFYEALATGTKSKKPDSEFLPLEMLDTLAMWLAISLRDPVVAASEQTLIKSWKSSRRETELLRRLSNFTPAYYGVVEQPPSDPVDASYILLQDITANFARPCAIDIKMGTQTYEPDALEEKRTREVSKYPPQTKFGMRIVSMRIYDPTHADTDERGYRSFPKTYGRGLESRDAVLSALRLFFSSGTDPPAKLRARVVTSIVMQLRLLRSWFEDNDSLAFYASSLLLVYDGDSGRGDATSSKMIDFGHVRREAGGDPGYVLGLQTLISLLTALLNDAHAAAE